MIPIENAPEVDLARSPAAAAVGRWAAASDLLLAHFEHRTHLSWPDTWLPQDRSDLGGEARGWILGRLREPKFFSFQLDRRIGGFHPGYRGKWTSHELLHGLVGFGFAPGRSLLWHATAARLSELLPVVLYYTLDEAQLRRCSRHEAPLFGSFCPACEAAAWHGPNPNADPTPWVAAAKRFFDRELAAVAKTRRLGRVVSHTHATLDLASDGLAYAASHGPRLRSARFADYVERFFGPNEGLHTTLDELIHRVETLFAALSAATLGENVSPAPLEGDRWRWIAQDLAWRTCLVMEEAEGDVLDALDDAVLRPLETATRGLGHGQQAIQAAIGGYRSVASEWIVPPAEDLFAVGYSLPGGLGRSEDQIVRGVQSALPGTWALLGDQAEELAADFTWEDPLFRAGIGLRFAAWLPEALEAEEEHPSLDQARFEAAIVHAPPCDEEEQTLRGEKPASVPVARAAGAQCIVVSHAVSTSPTVLAAEGAAVLEAPLALVIQRQPDGEVAVFQVSPAAATALSPDTEDVELGQAVALPTALWDRVPEEEREALLSLGVVVPKSWAL